MAIPEKVTKTEHRALMILLWKRPISLERFTRFMWEKTQSRELSQALLVRLEKKGWAQRMGDGWGPTKIGVLAMDKWVEQRRKDGR